ncbi:aminoglycoside phosphotransferase family protein [Streptodolium elevatio]
MYDIKDPQAAAHAVSDANRVWGLRFGLGERFADGLQGGAWNLAEPGGRRAVLKLRRADPRMPIGDVARAVERVRGAGYPTPRWLATGDPGGGLTYHVQEFAYGNASTPLTPDTIRPLLDTLELHAGLDPLPSRDRSAEASASSTGEGPGSLRRAVAALGEPGTALLDRYDRLLAAAGPTPLPGGDLVHGDFNSVNILLRADGTVSAVIDIDELGSGTRVLDYAALLREAYVEGYHPDVAARIRAAAVRVAGPAVLAWCAAPAAFFIAPFKARHQPHRLAATLDHLHTLADDLAKAF